MCNSKFGSIPNKLSIKQHLELALVGFTFIRYMKPEGYSSAVPVYLVRCSQHGFYLEKPSGYTGYFVCTSCLEETQILRSRKNVMPHLS